VPSLSRSAQIIFTIIAYFHFSGAINNTAALMTMWESVIYWTKKLLFAIAALLYCLGCFPSSWLLQAPPSPADKFTYFIIVTRSIIIAYYYYFHFSGAKKNAGGRHLLD
jgi:hypothetical protein